MISWNIPPIDKEYWDLTAIFDPLTQISYVIIMMKMIIINFIVTGIMIELNTSWPVFFIYMSSFQYYFLFKAVLHMWLYEGPVADTWIETKNLETSGPPEYVWDLLL